MSGHKHPISTVLVVEDDVLINMAPVMSIRNRGYLVLSAANAGEAMLVLEVHSEIDVLFTDVKMPGSIDGLGLALAARSSHPHIEIVIASGTFRPTEQELPARAVFLPKPYSAEQIGDILRDLIDDAPRLVA
ncbi:MAG: response regulator [Devosia sp.]